MKSSELAKTLLIVGLLTWGLSENNVINADIQLQNKIESFDYDLGNQKVFPSDYKIIIDWGKQQFVYGTGNNIITMKKSSSFTYDMSWIPFFKTYNSQSIWEIEGLQFKRSPIRVKYKAKRYGFISRSEMIKNMRKEISQELIKSFNTQTFYHSPFLYQKSNLIFSKC